MKIVTFLLSQRLILGGVQIMMVSALGMGFAYVTHILFAKWLGVEQYGYYVYGLACLGVLTTLVQMGMNTSTIRITSELRAEGKTASILGLSRFSNRVVMLMGLASAIVGFTLLGVLPELFPDQHVTTLAIVLPTAIVLGLLNQRMAILQGHEQVARAMMYLEIARPLILLIGVFAFVHFLAVSATLAMLVNLMATAVALVVAAMSVQRLLSKGDAGIVEPIMETRRWLAISLPYLMIGMLTVAMDVSDVLMLGSLAGGVAVGLYAPALKLTQLMVFPMLAIRSRAAPLLARLHAQHNQVELQRQMNIATLTSGATAVVLLLTVVGLREFLLGLFGPQFIEAAPIILVLAIGMGFFAITGNAEVFLIMGPFERITMAIYAFVVILNIAMNWVLIPEYGVLGAAYATVMTMIVRGMISTAVVWHRTGILPWAPLSWCVDRDKGTI